MKASESSERYVGKVRECSNYAVRSAKNFIDNEKNLHRQPCSEGEKELATKLKEDLKGFCDEVTEDTFTASQKAYTVSNMLVFVFMLLAAGAAIAGFFVNELIIIATIVFAFLALLAYFGAFGGTSKKVEGTNIFALRKCSGDVNKRIIIEANLDAPFKRKISGKTERILKTINLIAIIIYIAFGVVSLLVTYQNLEFFASDVFLYIAFSLVVFLPIPLILSRSVIPNSSTPGVADNLIGCYTASGALRYLSEMDLRLHNTELCVLLTGAKNAKSAGASTYCKMHAESDKKIDTTVICLDTIYNLSSLNVKPENKKIAKLLSGAAENAETTLANFNPKYLKGDAKSFAKAGIPTATITSLPDSAPLFYKSITDNADNLDVKSVEATIKILLEAAYLKDGE